MPEKFDGWLKRYRIISRIILLSSMIMLWRSAEWSMWFAVGNGRNGMEMAAIMAAIQAPSTFFAGWAFKVYTEGTP